MAGLTVGQGAVAGAVDRLDTGPGPVLDGPAGASAAHTRSGVPCGAADWDIWHCPRRGNATTARQPVTARGDEFWAPLLHRLRGQDLCWRTKSAGLAIRWAQEIRWALQPDSNPAKATATTAESTTRHGEENAKTYEV